MNIFVTSPDPEFCAKVLDDKRVVKMVLESAQLMSTAMNLAGANGPYKTTHVNHPCSIWTRETFSNYAWLLDHFISLCDEYTYRYNKQHKCSQLIKTFEDGLAYINDGSLTTFVNCTTFKQEQDVFKAYQLALEEKWNKDIRTPTWYGEYNKPNWKVLWEQYSI